LGQQLVLEPWVLHRYELLEPKLERLGCSLSRLELLCNHKHRNQYRSHHDA